MASLSEYVDRQVAAGRKPVEIAAGLGISRSYMIEIAAGKKKPSLETAFKIEDRTGGVVPARSLLGTEAAA